MNSSNNTSNHNHEFRRRTDIERSSAAVLSCDEEFRSAVEVAGLGILDYSPLSGEMHWNAAARQHFGLSPDAAVNYNVFLVGIHDRDRSRVVQLLNRALERENEGTFSAEFRTTGIEDGRERLIEARGQAFFNQSGEAVRFVWTSRDVTDRRRAEEELRESEQRLRAVFDNAALAIVEVDPEDRIVAANERLCKVLGYSAPEELIGVSVHDLTAPEDRPESDKMNAELHEGRRDKLDYEKRYLRKDGTPVWVRVSVSAVRDAEGRHLRSIGTIEDIHERKRMEEELRASEERYRLLFDKSPLPKWVFELKTLRFLEVNDAAIDHYGYSREEFLGMTLADIRTPEEFEKLGRQVAKCSGGRKFEGQVQTKHRKKNGQVVEVDIRYREIEYAASRAGLGVVIDITERRRAEEERNRIVAELERSNRELQQFAYVASHDLQEPLRTVSSFVDLLAARYKGRLDPTADRYIGFVVEGANRMSTLINDLLLYSRVGTRGKAFEPVDLNAVLADALSDLRKAIADSGAEIKRDELPTVSGDASQLAQLLQNLIANALKFQKPGVAPRIHISAERKGNDWVFGVRDNGIGIEPRFFDRIFTIFQRLHTREEYSGTGVGLAICKRIVERHGGRIWVESKPGEGSVFYFTLPAGT